MMLYQNLCRPFCCRNDNTRIAVIYLLAAVVLAVLLPTTAGIFKLGKFVRLLPHTVMYGYLNGLALIMFMAQVVTSKISETDISY